MNNVIEKYCHAKLDSLVKYSSIFTFSKQLSFNEASRRAVLISILENEIPGEVVGWGAGLNGTWYWISHFVSAHADAGYGGGQLNMKELEYLLNVRNKRLIHKLPTLIFENFIKEMKKCNNTPAWRHG